jgi:hypothetical protein
LVWTLHATDAWREVQAAEQGPKVARNEVTTEVVKYMQAADRRKRFRPARLLAEARLRTGW